MEPTTFRALLKRYRMAAGLTQEALAERASLSTRAVSDLERGLSRAPRYDTLDLLTRAMNLEAEPRAALFAAARPAVPRENAKAAPLQVLPFPPTALLGREQEIAQALGFLQERGVCLLTVTGPGGVGKTRLALEIAHNLRAGFADGLAWIDLTALRDPSLVPQTVAHVLGLREQAEHAFPEQVRAFLQDKQFLLLLDNFEHLLEAADFVADLLVHCPRLHILVTSRTPLHLRAEQQLVLTPLTPAAAVALFRERAQRVQPHSTPPRPLWRPFATRWIGCHWPSNWRQHTCGCFPCPCCSALRTGYACCVGAPGICRSASEPCRKRLPGATTCFLPHNSGFRRLSIFMGGCTLAAAESICRERNPSLPMRDSRPSRHSSMPVWSRWRPRQMASRAIVCSK